MTKVHCDLCVRDFLSGSLKSTQKNRARFRGFFLAPAGGSTQEKKPFQNSLGSNKGGALGQDHGAAVPVGGVQHGFQADAARGGFRVCDKEIGVGGFKK